jgi:hypothetical protein
VAAAGAATQQRKRSILKLLACRATQHTAAQEYILHEYVRCRVMCMLGRW